MVGGVVHEECGKVNVFHEANKKKIKWRIIKECHVLSVGRVGTKLLDWIN